MQYNDLINKVQQYSGFDSAASEDSLQLIVETLSARLNVPERQDFANQLPVELREMALAPLGTEKFTQDEMVDELWNIEDASMAHTKKQLLAVWQALKEAISSPELICIKNHLPKRLAPELS